MLLFEHRIMYTEEKNYTFSLLVTASNKKKKKIKCHGFR